MRSKLLLFPLILFSIATQLNPMRVIAQSAREQTEFNEDSEDYRIKPVPLPSEVIAAVMRTKEGREAQADAAARHATLHPEDLLEGMPIRVSNDHKKTFLLRGSGDLTGGDNTWYWIVRQSGNLAQVLLFAHTNSIDILPRKTLGYRDIEAGWASPNALLTETYKYNGQSYRLYRSKWCEIFTPDGKPTRCGKAFLGDSAN